MAGDHLRQILERMRATKVDVNPDVPFTASEGTRSVMSSIASLKKRAADETYTTLDPHELRKAARLLLKARRVAIYAIGDTAITAAAFANYLLKIGVVCIMTNQYGDDIAMSTALGKDDVALAISYSRRQFSRLAYEIDIARSNGCKIIAVTSDAALRERMADVSSLLLCPMAESVRGKIATYYAQTCLRYALECLHGEVFLPQLREERPASHAVRRQSPGHIAFVANGHQT